MTTNYPTYTSVREANIHIRDLEKRLIHAQREEGKLDHLIEGLRYDNYNLKKNSYQNQAVATRLIVQRNTSRFLNDKITNTIRECLRKANCKVSRESSIFEMLSLVGELIDEAWRKHETVLRENSRLRESNNILREENAVFHRRSKNRDKLINEEDMDVFSPIDASEIDERLSERLSARDKKPQKKENKENPLPHLKEWDKNQLKEWPKNITITATKPPNDGWTTVALDPSWATPKPVLTKPKGGSSATNN